ncbi:unnamed protein product [Durusdinium trenchii]|uniref:BTB domain-containing protein n=1 Tax=Durusdinium trenchii TaxID=1381693 RepID=A0ABP0IVV9_9DINO
MSSSGAANELSSFTFQCPDEVVQRLARLYGDERHSDVTFLVQSNQDTAPQRFVAHRSIIAMWSEPLGSMLCGPFAEGSAKEVKLLDVEPAAFEVLLKLIYTGVVDISPETVLSILDVAVRFDVAALMQFSVQFLQNHATSEHACRMLEIGVQYHLGKLVDKCIELIVTDDHILESEDFNNLSQSAMIELAKHDAWNLHEDNIFDIFMRWSDANSGSADEKRRLAMPFLEQLRFPHMSTEKLKKLSTTGDVPSELLFEALFCKLSSEADARCSGCVEDESVCSPSAARRRQRVGSLLFSWVPTSRVTVSGELRENARHTSSSGFTGVRGDRRMRHGRFAWTIDITETQSSWIFVGVVQAEDLNDVAWRASGHMLYCLDSRFFHQGSGQNHPLGDRRMVSGDCIHVVLDCTRHTLAFGVNDEQPIILFRDLEATWYVPAVDLRDCGDKVRILSSRMTTFCAARSPSSSQAAISGPPEEAPWSGPSDESRPELEDRRGQISDSSRAARWQSDLPRRHTVQSPLETVPAFATRLSQPRQFGSASVLAVERGGSTLGRGGPAPRLQSPSAPRGPRGRATSQRGSSPGPIPTEPL